MSIKLMTITDKSTNNPLFTGQEQYFFGGDLTIDGGNDVSTAKKTNQPRFIASDGTSLPQKLKNAFNRMKSKKQLVSFSTNNYKLTLYYREEDLTVENKTVNGAVVNWLSLSKLMHLIRTPKTYYLKDSTIIDALSIGDYAYYNSYGFPVVITKWNMKKSNKSGLVTVTLTFEEDKDDLVN